MSSLVVFLFGVIKQFCRFWIQSEKECYTHAEYGLQHNSTPTAPSPPPPQLHTVCIYCTFTFGKGEWVGEVREKVEGQQFTRGVENINMTDCISSLQTLLNTSKDDI